MSFKACAVASDAKTRGNYLAKLILQRLAECSDEEGVAPIDYPDLVNYSEASAEEISSALAALVALGIGAIQDDQYDKNGKAFAIAGGSELEGGQ